MVVADFRSDTVTRPSAPMREAMARAEVGDDVYREDPSVAELEREVAGLLGKEAALFVPSGTMSNQIALLVHTERGDEVIVSRDAHMRGFESGAGGALAGIQFVSVGDGGSFSADELSAAMKPERDYFPRTRLVAVENTHAASGGRVFPEQRLARVIERARELGLALHLDGARVWNAAVASGREPSALVQGFDTVSVCFSKGLGAPVGSALVGSTAAIRRARRFRKMLGGGMRQSGILAAGALFALRRQRARIAEDHENARLLASELASLPGLRANPEAVETNIVLVEVDGVSADALAKRWAADGVLVAPLTPRSLRFVLHLDVSRDAVLAAVERIRSALENPP